jgi:tRNA nucleotidyltransferase (CCA-adding enzyme)
LVDRSEKAGPFPEVLSRIARKVTPTKAENEKLESIAKNVAGRLEDALQKDTARPEIMLGGSFAKGTWLSGSADIDYFLLYPVGYPREKLEGEAIDSARRAVRDHKITMRFAEHPYVEAFVDGARVNLVPCYKVEKGQWQSAVDRSPFHTEYVKSHFDEKLRLETRILKAFIRGSKIYGAEVKTQGFSGYVCEVLTLKYDSFVEVLKHFSTLKKGEIISVEPYDEALAKSFTSPVVILDPVDTARNLGSAISTINLSRFILRSRTLLSKPSIRSFDEQASRGRSSDLHYSKQVKDQLLDRIMVLRFRTKPRSVDVLWGQLYKSLDALANKIETWGFNLLRSKASSNEQSESALIYLLNDTTISDFSVKNGPDVFRGEDFSKYMEKNRTRALLSWLNSEGRAVSFFVTKERNSIDIFERMKKTIRSTKEIRSVGLSRGIAEEVRFAKIASGRGILLHISRKDEWLGKDILSLVSTEDELRKA